METKCSVSFIPNFLFGAIYQVKVCKSDYCNLEQYLNYDEAFKRYNEIKAQGDFDSLELVSISTIEEVVNNGNNDE